MDLAPLLNQSHRSLRQPTSDRRAVMNPDESFVFGIDGMKMGRIVIDEIHVDDDPVELTQPWHGLNLRRRGWKAASRSI